MSVSDWVARVDELAAGSTGVSDSSSIVDRVGISKVRE